MALPAAYPRVSVHEDVWGSSDVRTAMRSYGAFPGLRARARISAGHEAGPFAVFPWLCCSPGGMVMRHSSRSSRLPWRCTAGAQAAQTP